MGLKTRKGPGLSSLGSKERLKVSEQGQDMITSIRQEKHDSPQML